MVPSLGTPFRIHLMSDLLDEKLDVENAKLVIFANAYRISDTMHAAIRQKLQSEGGSQPTLVFFHAPGTLNGKGLFDQAGPGVLLQSELQMHSEPESLDTVFAMPERLIPNAPDFGPLEGKSYTNLSRYISTWCPGCPTRVGGITPAASRAPVSPWFSCSNASTATSRCTVLGRSSASDIGTLCWCDHTTHRMLFSASPGLPLPAWRAILLAAGVHVWAPAGVIGCDKTDNISMGAFFDMADLSATVGVGIARAAPMHGMSPTELGRVNLPRMSTRVTDAITGALVCSNCSSFIDVRLSTSMQAYRFDWQSGSDGTIAPAATPSKTDDANALTSTPVNTSGVASWGNSTANCTAMGSIPLQVPNPVYGAAAAHTDDNILASSASLKLDDDTSGVLVVGVHGQGLVMLPSPPERLAHFAWWHDVVEETHPFSSFTFGMPDRPARSGAGALPMNASWLVHAHRTYGVQGMWNVESTFFGSSAARHGYLALRPDWRIRWAAVSAAAAPLLLNGTIIGFFIGDELYPQKVTPAELRTVADAVRADFPSPSVVSWVNFCACPPFGKQLPWTGEPGSWAPGAGFDIPPSLSWASIDMYDGLRQSVWPGTPFVPRVQAAVRQLLLPKMLANQSLMLVPGSYATNLTSEAGWCNITCGDAKAARDAVGFYQWAVEDGRVVGLAVSTCSVFLRFAER
jgi:hypothetical protein